MFAEVRSDCGSGVALVYVPGIDGSGNMLFGTADTLAERFRVVRLRYGDDEGTERDTYPDLAASVVEQIAQLGIERAVLVSESFGGAVALQAALDHPERVAGLAIVNSFVHYPARFRLTLSRFGLPLLPLPVLRLGRKIFGTRTLFGSLTDADAEHRLLEHNDTWGIDGYLRRLRMIAGLDLRPRLGKVTQPVSLFVGDRDRVVASLPQARLMESRIPDVELRVIEGGGHVILPLPTLPWGDWLEELARRAGCVA